MSQSHYRRETEPIFTGAGCEAAADDDDDDDDDDDEHRFSGGAIAWSADAEKVAFLFLSPNHVDSQVPARAVLLPWPPSPGWRYLVLSKHSCHRRCGVNFRYLYR